MNEASPADSFTERVRAACADRGLAMTASRPDGCVGSGFRPLNDDYEAQVAYRPEGSFGFILEIHPTKDDGAGDLLAPDPVAYRLTVRRSGLAWSTAVHARLMGATYADRRPPEPPHQRALNETEAFEQVIACLDWYAALDTGYDYALTRLYRQIDGLFRRSPVFEHGGTVVETRTHRVEIRPGVVATLLFEPNPADALNGLTFTIKETSKRHEHYKGFSAYLGSQDADGGRQLCYDYSCLHYRGDRPDIPSDCTTPDQALAIAAKLVGFMRRQLERDRTS